MLTKLLCHAALWVSNCPMIAPEKEGQSFRVGWGCGSHIMLIFYHLNKREGQSDRDAGCAFLRAGVCVERERPMVCPPQA